MNGLAREIYLTMRGLACGPDGALALFHLELSPGDLHGLRIRLMQCAALWGAADGGRD